MKKIIGVVLLFVFIFTFTSCITADRLTETENKSDSTDTTVDYNEIMNNIIAEDNYVPDETTESVYKLEDNVLYGKGANFHGILGEKEEYYNDWQKIADNVEKFEYYSCVLMYLTTDHMLYGLGCAEGGVLQKDSGIYDYQSKNVSEPVLLFEDCKDFSLGARFALAQKSDGSVWFWGESLNGQSTQIIAQIITPVKILDNAKMIKALMYTTAWIDDNNTLYMCGDNSYGQLGNGKKGTGYPTMYKDIYEEPFATLQNCVNIFCSRDREYVYAVTDDGSTYVWGGNEYTEPTNLKRVYAENKS